MGIYVVIPLAIFVVVVGVCLWWDRKCEAREAEHSGPKPH